MNTITGIIASLQANEAIKILLGKKYEEKLLYFNVWKNKLMKIKVKQNASCPACKGEFEYLTGKKEKDIVKFCGSSNYLIRAKFNLR